MPSLDQNIRGALQNTLGAVTGIPEIAYEGITYKPKAGTAFVAATIVSGPERPATMGDGHLVLHEGSFEIVLVYPSTKGTATIEAMANLVKSAFKASGSATVGSDTVRFRHAERRGPITPDADWLRLAISVPFYLYSQDY